MLLTLIREAKECRQGDAIRGKLYLDSPETFQGNVPQNQLAEQGDFERRAHGATSPNNSVVTGATRPVGRVSERNDDRRGDAIRGELLIDGEPFCSTLEREGVEVLPLCYRVYVTQSPRFGRLLPLLHNVPDKGRKRMREGIRIHVGRLPRHSSGCILVPDRETERELTELLLEAQKKREEVYIDVREGRIGDDYIDEADDGCTPLPPTLTDYDYATVSGAL